MTQAKIPIVCRIDVEPDNPFMDRTRGLPWKGFERGVDSMRTLRNRIAAATGSPAHFDWQLRMDPQIAEAYGTPAWAGERYAHLLDSIAADGDEIGIHIHAFRWLAGEGQWCEDYGNQEWVDHCVGTASDAFRKVFGRTARTSSIGHRWLNNATVERLESVGIAIDLTVEPGHPFVKRELGVTFTENRRSQTGPISDDLPSYRDTPRQPYLPSKTDFRVADPARRHGMVLMPLTTGLVPRGPLLRLYDAMRRIPPGTKGHVTLAPIVKPRWFHLIVDTALRQPECDSLAMSMRTHMFAWPALHNAISAGFDSFLRRPDIERFEFTTSTRVCSRLLRTGEPAQ